MRAPILGVQDMPADHRRPGGQRRRGRSADPRLRRRSWPTWSPPARRASPRRPLCAPPRAHPDQFEPVFTSPGRALSSSRPRPRPATCTRSPAPRSSPPAGATRSPPQLAAHLVGTVGPITADELHRLGAPYDATSTVGQSGLEAIYERRLAGTPRTEIRALNADGAPTATLASFPGRPGRPVRTSLDPYTQRAAETALASQPRHAAMIALRVSTGQILADVSDPVSQPFDQALEGAYPPGSTFKVLISAALFAHGLTPSSPASCPPDALGRRGAVSQRRGRRARVARSTRALPSRATPPSSRSRSRI